MRRLWGAAPEGPHGLELPPGAQVAGFVIETRLAAGSFGTLYQARRGPKRFALKLVQRDERGEREVDALRRVRALPVVGFHGYGLWPEEAPRFIVLALELVEGLALDAWARAFNPSARELLGRVMLPLASALGKVHAAGVVHRDVKEANIVVRREDGAPVLVDFGAAGLEGAHRLTLRLPPGTPEYRSPEVLRFAREWEGDAPPDRPGDDLWALGVTLYALLTRTLPFGDRHGPLVNTILAAAPEPPQGINPRVPPPVGALCLRLLAREPTARVREAGVLERELREALAGADAAWDVPLFPGAREAPTLPEPGVMDAPVPRRPVSALLALGAMTAVLLVGHAGSTPPQELAPSRETPGAGFRHELAPGDMTGEVGFSAGLTKSSTPAPVAPATPPAEPPMRPTPKKNRLLPAALAAAVCTTPACVSAPKVIAPPPPYEPCPAGSKETHARLGVLKLSRLHVALEGYEKVYRNAYYPIRVRSGPISTEVREVFQKDTVPLKSIIKGRLYVREGIVYGRFTELIMPGEEPVPVCMDMRGWGSDPGTLTNEGKREDPLIGSRQALVFVDEFEQVIEQH